MDNKKDIERALVPYFGEESPERAQDKALERLKKGGKLFLLHITDEGPTRSIRYRTGQMGEKSELVKTFRETQKKVQREAAEDYIEKIKNKAAKQGVSIEDIFRAGDPAKEVLKAIDEFSIQLVVVEKLRERITEIFLGDEVNYLTKEAPCEVLTVS